MNAVRNLEVGVDIDGCLYDFVDEIRAYIHTSTGRSLTTMPDARCWTFYKQDWGMTTPEFLAAFRDGVNAGHIFTIGDPRPGALAALTRIASGGHQIRIVTSRSIAGAEEAAAVATRDWLARWAIPHVSLTITDDKTSVPTDIFIEDNVENYLALDATGTEVYLLDRPWNTHHDGRRVADWNSFADRVDALATRPA